MSFIHLLFLHLTITIRSNSRTRNQRDCDRKSKHLVRMKYKYPNGNKKKLSSYSHPHSFWMDDFPLPLNRSGDDFVFITSSSFGRDIPIFCGQILWCECGKNVKETATTTWSLTVTGQGKMSQTKKPAPKCGLSIGNEFLLFFPSFSDQLQKRVLHILFTDLFFQPISRNRKKRTNLPFWVRIFIRCQKMWKIVFCDLLN